jgi:TIR domain
MARIHLIESSKDIHLCKKFEEGLRDRHKVSWDINFLVPGREWRRELEDAVREADVLVAIFTKNSIRENSDVISSQWMAADIGAARALGKIVIPVLIGEEKVIQIPTLVDDIFVLRSPSEDERDIRDAIEKVDKAIKENMERQEEVSKLTLPAGYAHLASNVLRFRDDHPNNKTVFVMMKFFDTTTIGDKWKRKLLDDIWKVITVVLGSYGLEAVRADKKDYHDQLWENICVYMLGSPYGIAILEDRVAEELNPIVTLEYGFMRAFNRKVALFRDSKFQHDRADFIGRLSKSFEIDDKGALIAETLKKAVQDWLLDLGIPPKSRD